MLSTTKVTRNNTKPSAMSAERYISESASANSLAMVAAIELPGISSDAVSSCALPSTKVTAIVSPSARPRPKNTPPTTAERVYGSTTSHTTSQRVEPSAYDDSLSRPGTVRNTSRITEEMKGITMIASTRPAVPMPRPSGGPENSAPTSGSPPKCSSTHG